MQKIAWIFEILSLQKDLPSLSIYIQSVPDDTIQSLLDERKKHKNNNDLSWGR